jgi:hypothetical protein
VVTILNDDGGSLLARALAPCLTLQQLWCFGLVERETEFNFPYRLSDLSKTDFLKKNSSNSKSFKSKVCA